MVNKKAYIKTLEAVIAILIAFVVLYTLVLNKVPETEEVPQDIRLTQKSIINEIESNDFLRTEITKRNETAIYNFINATIKPGLEFNFTICPLDESCGTPYLPPKEIYAESIVVTQGEENNIFRLFIWRK